MLVPIPEYSRCIKVTKDNPNAIHISPQNREPVSWPTSEMNLLCLSLLLISENCSRGCLEKKLLAKDRSCLWEGQRASDQLYLPSANTPLDSTIPNSVLHLKKLENQDGMQTWWSGSVCDSSSCRLYTETRWERVRTYKESEKCQERFCGDSGIYLESKRK